MGSVLMDIARLSAALTFDAQTGIWSSARSARVAYPEGDHATCFAIEDRSFWFRHRNRCIVAAVRRHRCEGFILDIGGGNGVVARALIDAGFETVLLEPGPAGAQNARRVRRIPDVICSSLEDAALRDGTVPAAGMFDVIEHIEDDRGVVEHVHRILRPGGCFYITVPAFNWLWSGADVEAMHYRRYSPATMQAALASHFDVVYVTALFERLVPAFFLSRALPYAVGWHGRSQRQFQAEHQPGGATGTAWLERLLAHEVRRIEAGRSLRWGSTLLVVARRR
ncbi:MAG TPA: class I SAM-dependent methyltransferase [Vicinamibacterales bacterium]|nr:class I SAM-dependent methyltransferase [Vicinamibacterales bacterium]